MNDPAERITLALKPKPAPAGGPKPGDSTPLPHGLDHAVFNELKQAAQTYDYLAQFGTPVEFWEAVRLARSHRGVKVGADGDEAGAEVDAGLTEELQAIRRQLSPMVQDLRQFLKKVPDLPKPGEALEVALGFLLASSREHQAVAKWLSESDKHLSKAASKLRGLYDIAAPYLEVLRPWSLDGPRAPLGAKKAAAPVVDTPETLAAIQISPEALENFRRAFISRQIFIEADLPAVFWEILLLNTVERIPCQTRLDAIAQARKDKQLAVYHEEARALHSKLLPLRARHGRWVSATSDWLKTLPGVPKDEGLFEASVGFLVVESGAMDRARRWLTEPEASAREAAAYLVTLSRQVKACIATVKQK